MSRAARPRSRKSSSIGNTFAGIFIGLVIGVLIAAALAWYFSRPYEFLKKNENAAPGPAQNVPGSKPIALPGKPGDKPVEHPVSHGATTVATAPATSTTSTPAASGEKKFDFYDILQKGDQATLPPPQAQSAPKAAASEKLYLQLGAFSDPSDADNLKARLALTGTEASVQRIETPDKGTLYRVRIGPYGKPDEMNNARAQLAQIGIESSVVKVKSKDAATASR